MKRSPLPVLLSLVFGLTAVSAEMIESGVWKWTDTKVEKTDSGEKRALFAGEAADLSNLSVHATTLNPGEKSHASQTHDNREVMVVVKEGQLSVTIGAETKILGPGSVAVALAGESHGWHNAGTTPVTYYVLQFQSRRGFTGDLALKNEPSMLIDEQDVAFSANPRGGYRGFFNRSTASLELFELHETTLMEGVQNHPVHTHGAEEMVIMLDGLVDLEINGIRYEGKPGDVYFIAAMDPHTLFTKGDKPSRYFAFQWR